MEYMLKKRGWVEIICGSMFAGKTEELLRRIKRAEYAKQNIVMFKPSIDVRYSDDEVVSHNKNSYKSITIDHARDMLKHVTKDVDIVAIDEVQFLDDEVVDIIEYFASKKKRVICTGLDKDFRGEPFTFMPRLLSTAEFVTKLSAICVVCGDSATRTQRIVNGKPAKYTDPLILIGADENYEPRCRHCHKVPGKKKRYDTLG